ncbi:hypothetical protein DY000_02036331 [Brassica cretica]|uniref:RAB6-interacting golgin n=1 Tax=Brassica cretica TaxID=69181 RepID=A0ABQ7BK34_BRACR|nr:hypothetical protein DY000_02036331 [Brassica cretica]
MEETIKKYVDVPIRPRPRENFGDGILSQARSKEIEDEIFKCKAEMAKVEQQLGYFLKHPNQWATRDDIEYQEKILEETLDKVRSRKWATRDDIEYQEKILEETLDKVRSRKKCLEAQNEAFDASNCLLQTDVEISPSG